MNVKTKLGLGYDARGESFPWSSLSLSEQYTITIYVPAFKAKREILGILGMRLSVVVDFK